jgi:hypothetical protein
MHEYKFEQKKYSIKNIKERLLKKFNNSEKH